MDIVSNVEELVYGGVPPENAGIFGAVVDEKRAELALIPVPWDATASYGLGAASGAEGILEASHQLDLQDLAFGRPYTRGIYMLPVAEEIKHMNARVAPMISQIREGVAGSENLQKEVNEYSAKVNDYVYQNSKKLLNEGKLVGVVGGDHSCPFGLIKALSEKHKDFSIIHIDAHFDLRQAYEGFTWSHASIMRNVMDLIPNVTHITQIGIRDFSFPEQEYSASLEERASVFYGRDLFRKKASGMSFAEVTKEILSKLSERIYISFDIDGMDPTYCPSTGTPVAGGLSFDEAVYLIEEIGLSLNKKVIGFDLCEVVDPKNGSEYDCNVGARILYKLCGSLLHSNKE